MNPVTRDLTWRRNAPGAYRWTLATTSGPYDLSGYTFLMQVRAYPGASGSPLISLGMAASGTPGFYLDDAAAGVVTLTQPLSGTLNALPRPADITSGQVTSFAYDILLIAPDGGAETMMEGHIILKSGVSHP